MNAFHPLWVPTVCVVLWVHEQSTASKHTLVTTLNARLTTASVHIRGLPSVSASPLAYPSPTRLSEASTTLPPEPFGFAVPTDRLFQDQRVVSDISTLGIQGLQRPLVFHRYPASGDSL